MGTPLSALAHNMRNKTPARVSHHPSRRLNGSSSDQTRPVSHQRTVSIMFSSFRTTASRRARRSHPAHGSIVTFHPSRAGFASAPSSCPEGSSKETTRCAERNSKNCRISAAGKKAIGGGLLP